MVKARKLKRPVVDVLYSRTLEECVESVLGPHDLEGANPYSPKNHEESFPLGEIKDALEAHPVLIGKSPRRARDTLRSTLNAMISIRRVGATRKARYSYDSLAKVEIGQDVLKLMIRALLARNGKAEWKDLQEALGVNDQITHLNFNSALNYLADNGIVVKKGQRPQQLPPDPETGALSTTGDSRVIVCTPKAWGWEPSVVTEAGPTEKDEYYVKGEDDTRAWDKVGGSGKETHSITLTGMTSDLLGEIEEGMGSLAEADSRRPANINRSTIIEVALWMLWRDIHNLEGNEVPSEVDGVDMALLAQRLAEYMSNEQG